jgi:hypothetical protein
VKVENCIFFNVSFLIVDQTACRRNLKIKKIFTKIEIKNFEVAVISSSIGLRAVYEYRRVY